MTKKRKIAYSVVGVAMLALFGAIIYRANFRAFDGSEENSTVTLPITITAYEGGKLARGWSVTIKAENVGGDCLAGRLFPKNRDIRCTLVFPKGEASTDLVVRADKNAPQLVSITYNSSTLKHTYRLPINGDVLGEAGVSLAERGRIDLKVIVNKGGGLKLWQWIGSSYQDITTSGLVRP